MDGGGCAGLGSFKRSRDWAGGTQLLPAPCVSHASAFKMGSPRAPEPSCLAAGLGAGAALRVTAVWEMLVAGDAGRSMNSQLGALRGGLCSALQAGDRPGEALLCRAHTQQPACRPCLQYSRSCTGFSAGK